MNRFIFSQKHFWILSSILLGLFLLHLGEAFSSLGWRGLGLILFGGGLVWGLLTLFITHFRLSMGTILVLNLLEVFGSLLNLLHKKTVFQVFSTQLVLAAFFLNILVICAFFRLEKSKISGYERKFSIFLIRQKASQLDKERLTQFFIQYVDESNQIINQLIHSLKQSQKTLK